MAIKVRVRLSSSPWCPGDTATFNFNCGDTLRFPRGMTPTSLPLPLPLPLPVVALLLAVITGNGAGICDRLNVGGSAGS